MQEIVFQASFGDERKTVRLTQPDGMGSETWKVLIDNYYKGGLWKRGDSWVCYGTHSFTFEDIQILGEIIEHHA